MRQVRPIPAARELQERDTNFTPNGNRDRDEDRNRDENELSFRD